MTEETFARNDQVDLQEDLDADETLSLCDLPIEGNNSCDEACESNFCTTDQESFQFFNGFCPQTIPASSQDIIFCGKILSYNQSPPSLNAIDSLNDLQRSQLAAKAQRTSHSVDYRKQNCKTSPKMMRTASLAQKLNDPKPSCKWFRRYDTSVDGILASATPAATRPKWPLFMLGFVKTPAKMELKDIRSRQSRMAPPSPLLWSDESIRDGGKACWSLVRTLSRKGKGNGMLSASLGLVARV